MGNSLGCFAIVPILEASEKVLYFSGFLSKQCYWPPKLCFQWGSTAVTLPWQHHLHGQSLVAPWEAKPAFQGHPSYDISAELKTAGTCSDQQPPTSLLSWEALAPTVCIQMCLLTQYLPSGPEKISRYLAFQILYGLWIASRQGNEDLAFQEPNLCVSQELFLFYIFPSNLLFLSVTVPIGFGPGTSLGRMETICSICTSRTTKCIRAAVRFMDWSFLISGKSMSF